MSSHTEIPNPDHTQTNNPQPNHLVPSQGINMAQVQSMIQAALESENNRHQQQVADLTNEIMALKASSESKTKKDKKPKDKSATKAKDSTTSTHNTFSSKEAMSTPKRFQRASSAPPEATNTLVKKPSKFTKKALEITKAPSPKRHPQQMQTGDFPEHFLTTKNAMFVHVKILWGLLKQDSVPKSPDPENVAMFYRAFSNETEVQKALLGSGTPLLTPADIQSLKNARAGRIRVGNSIVNLGDNFIRYAHGLMARLGLRVWCPNLEEEASTLYNAACRICAITTFQELAATRAYNFLHIEPSQLNNMPLLIQSYNHFVHFLMAAKFKKENKEEGKNAKDAATKTAQKNRERLRDARLDFAKANKFHKRYINILSQVRAHSDDEFNEKHNVYAIKTLPYRSKNANKFFRCLDITMISAANKEASRSRRRIRKLPKEPIPSTFKVPPKNLPLDFYDAAWYQSLTVAQKRTIPDVQAVAFLPDASQSLKPKAFQHADEALRDSSFSRKYWDILTKPYNLSGGDTSEAEDGEDEENTGSESDGIDLNAPSPDESEDEFFDEGDAGDLYEESFVGSDDDGEDDSGDNEQMSGIEEDEEPL